MCDQLATCTNFTFNRSWVLGDNPLQFPPDGPDGNCVLLASPSVAEARYDPACISGGVAGHMILPCRDDADCNDQGTCTAGACGE
eukprot:SAG22_NODE_541_length_9297_cov_9.387149_4_plen_85_part_00